MVKVFGFGVEHEQWEDEALICQMHRNNLVAVMPSCEAAEKYATSIIMMWESLTLFWESDLRFSEEFKEATKNMVGPDCKDAVYRMFAGPCLDHFGNGNYERILIVAKEGDTVIGHWWSKVSPICLDPRDGFESYLTESDFDEDALYEEALRYI